jgi:hypothetical protein
VSAGQTPSVSRYTSCISNDFTSDRPCCTMQRSVCGRALNVRGDQEESEFLRAGSDAGRPIARRPGATDSMPEKVAPWPRIHATTTAAKQSETDIGIAISSIQSPIYEPRFFFHKSFFLSLTHTLSPECPETESV